MKYMKYFSSEHELVFNNLLEYTFEKLSFFKKIFQIRSLLLVFFNVFGNVFINFIDLINSTFYKVTFAYNDT